MPPRRAPLDLPAAPLPPEGDGGPLSPPSRGGRSSPLPWPSHPKKTVCAALHRKRCNRFGVHSRTFCVLFLLPTEQCPTRAPLLCPQSAVRTAHRIASQRSAAHRPSQLDCLSPLLPRKLRLQPQLRSWRTQHSDQVRQPITGLLRFSSSSAPRLPRPPLSSIPKPHPVPVARCPLPAARRCFLSPMRSCVVALTPTAPPPLAYSLPTALLCAAIILSVTAASSPLRRGQKIFAGVAAHRPALAVILAARRRSSKVESPWQ